MQHVDVRRARLAERARSYARAMASPDRLRTALLALACVACAGPSAAPPDRERAREASSVSAGEGALGTIELWASYDVDEGWGVALTLAPDGCFTQQDEIGGPDGSDHVVRCTGCVEGAIAERMFAAARAAELVPEERGYDRQVRAPRGVGGHIGGYSLVAVREGGARLAPADEPSARALLEPMQAVLRDAERVIAADRSRCSAVE